MFRNLTETLLWKLQLDLDFHACGQLQRHQGFDRLGGGVLDVDQTLVSPTLKLLTAILVLVDSAQDGDDLFLGGQGDGPETLAPVRFAVSTIFSALWSIS